jgi:hypothetical protein
MTWIDLGNPIPKPANEQHKLFQWETGEVQRLSPGSHVAMPSLCRVLQERRTVRRFAPLEDDRLSDFLWHACRSHETWTSDLGFDLEFRASPSAGAIHPIHLVINRPGDPRWWLYEPRGHFLVELTTASKRLQGLREHSQQVVDASEAIQLLFLAEPGKTLAKYRDGCSLIWRDAGALLAIMALTARGMDLNFCPLGITGEPWASALVEQGELAGVGMALLGLAP